MLADIRAFTSLFWSAGIDGVLNGQGDATYIRALEGSALSLHDADVNGADLDAA
jgi:hypothetical protein